MYKMNNNILDENLDLANKFYFNNGIIGENVKKKILDVTHGDAYTKILCDMYIEHRDEFEDEYFQIAYDMVKTYNKNVFPIKGFNIYDSSTVDDLLSTLNVRSEVISIFKELGSFADRNMKNEKRKPRDYYELEKISMDLSEVSVAIKTMTENKSEKFIKNLESKMFRNNTTIDDLISFIHDKNNLMGDESFDINKLIELSESDNDIFITYNKNNITILEITSAIAIKKIGCNSLWCFSYGKEFEIASNHWDKYSYNGKVYVIVNNNKPSNSEEYMYTITHPFTDKYNNIKKYDSSDRESNPMFDMSNNNKFNPYNILEEMFGGDYEDIIYTFLNFD